MEATSVETQVDQTLSLYELRAVPRSDTDGGEGDDFDSCSACSSLVEAGRLVLSSVPSPSEFMDAIYDTVCRMRKKDVLDSP